MVGKGRILKYRRNWVVADFLFNLACVRINEKSGFVIRDGFCHLWQELKVKPDIQTFFYRDDFIPEKVFLRATGMRKHFHQQMPCNSIITPIRISISDEYMLFHY